VAASDRSTILLSLFGPPGPLYLGLIEKILPRVRSFPYQFMSVESFVKLGDEGPDVAGLVNYVIAAELIDMAHLAAITALIRTRKWVLAACSAYECENYIAFAGAIRGLLESSGDITDGLRNVSISLAEAHPTIRSALTGKLNDKIHGFEIEDQIGHYVRANWKRGPKTDPEKAKENIEYVRVLTGQSFLSVESLYRRLSAISHPSSSSLDYLYVPRAAGDGFHIDPDRDSTAIQKLQAECGEVPESCLVISFNAAALILRVLHKFGRHPKLPELRDLSWDAIPAWPPIKQLLDR
jgi:hypothetical protein